MTLTELREKLAAKQVKMAEVLAEAKNDEGQYDFNKVTILGADVKGSVAVAEKVQAMDAELNELAIEAETLVAAEQAGKNQDDRAKAAEAAAVAGNRLPHAGTSDGGKGGQYQPIKSLGELVAGQKGFQDYAAGGAAGGVKFSFDDVLPSDVIAKSMAPNTIGAKADMTTAAGWAPESVRSPGFVEAVTRPIQLLDIIPLAQTGQAQIVYMEETTRTHAAAETAEGGAFNESEFAHTEKTSPVRKITDSLPVTDEQLEDVAQVSSYIDGRLIFGLRQRLDSQSLIGDATGANLRGLKNVVGIQTQAKGVDPVPDAYFKAMTKIRVTGRAMPTHNLMHPTDWEGVRLLRTADGVYIWGNPSESGPERMWGLPVVQQDADAVGTGYVGSFQPAWLSLHERRGVDIQVGYVGTQFTTGKRTVRADMRLALVFYRPAAFASVTGL